MAILRNVGHKIILKLADRHPKTAIRLQYLGNTHSFLHLKHPRTINEKLQYLKLNQYYDNPLVSQCADKYRVREYLEEKGLERLLPKLYGVWEKASDIDWNTLPEQFVLKCNHGSQFNILCPDKQAINKEEACAKLDKWLSTEFWIHGLEFHYRPIPRRIIAEEYLGTDIHTWKYYCFNGIPKVMYVSSNGENGEYDKYYDFFDMDFRHLDITLEGHLRQSDTHAPAKPPAFAEMMEYASVLSHDFPFVRVDLYDVGGKICFSELTFTPTGGKMHLQPKETELLWGSWLTL